MPANIAVNATSTLGTRVTYTLSKAVDEAGDSVVPKVSCNHSFGSTFPIGVTTITCTATDADDTPGTVSASFTVTVKDTDMGLTGMTANIAVNATSPAGAVVSYTPPTAVDEARDRVAPAVSCDHPSGSTFPIGATTVTCTATDADDTPRTVSKTFTVTVKDATLVLKDLPANSTANATSPAGAVVTYTTPAATNLEGNPVPATIACSPASGTTFPIGTTTVTCSASATGYTNSPVSASFTVTVNDTDLSLSGMPADITTAATGPAGAVVSYTPPTAVDEAGDSPAAAVSCDHASGATFPIGATTVTCTATDADDAPGTISATFTVTVKDTDLALTGMPADITTAATDSTGAAVSYTPPTAVDEAGDSPAATVSCDHASGSTFPVGATTVTCTATDADDTNSPASASFTVTVQ